MHVGIANCYGFQTALHSLLEGKKAEVLGTELLVIISIILNKNQPNSSLLSSVCDSGSVSVLCYDLYLR